MAYEDCLTTERGRPSVYPERISEMTGGCHSDFRIESWLIQPRLNRIEHEGERLQVEPKIMHVLLYMSERPGHVVSKEELLENVWSDVVVTVDVVSRSISELRKIFQDDARSPRIIETIHRTGYRLIAPVDMRLSAGDRLPEPVLTLGGDSAGSIVHPGADRTIAPTSDRTGRVERVPGPRTTLIVLGLVAAVVVVYSFTDQSDAPPTLVTVSTPVTSSQGFEIHPFLSPDGTRIAFIWSGPDDGHLNVYVKTLASETALQLTDSPFYEYSPTWSPDGSEIAFARSQKGIYVVPATGGSERKLTDINPSSSPDVSWSPDGAAIAYTDRKSVSDPYIIFVLAFDVSEPLAVTAPSENSFGDATPRFSPDGQTLAFVRRSGLSEDVFLVPGSGGSAVRLTTDGSDIAGLDWSEDGDAIIFASNRAGAFQLWSQPVDGGEMTLVAAEGLSDLRYPSVRNGRLAFTAASIETNVWRFELGVDATDGERIISSTWVDESPAWSPDGSKISFVSSRSGTKEVWICNADGSQPTRLTRFNGTIVGNPSWSPDGERIAFDVRVQGHTDIYIVNAAGGNLQHLTSDASEETLPTWSVDGQYIYFSSNRDGSWQIWRVEADADDDGPASNAVQVTRDGGYYAQESGADGSLFYAKIDEAGIWRLDAERTMQSKVTEDLPLGHWANWSLRGDLLYYVERTANTPSISAFDLSTGMTSVLIRLGQEPRRFVRGMDVAPDGSSILISKTDHSRFDIMVAEL